MTTRCYAALQVELMEALKADDDARVLRARRAISIFLRSPEPLPATLGELLDIAANY